MNTLTPSGFQSNVNRHIINFIKQLISQPNLQILPISAICLWIGWRARARAFESKNPQLFCGKTIAISARLQLKELHWPKKPSQLCWLPSSLPMPASVVWMKMLYFFLLSAVLTDSVDAVRARASQYCSTDNNNNNCCCVVVVPPS